MTNSDSGGREPRQSVFGAGARILGIWIFGLIGAGSLFAILGRALDRAGGSYSDDGSVGGLFAGVALFTCARLWARERR